MDNKYRYACLMRPPTPGAVPRDGLDFVTFDEGFAASHHHYWGVAVYNRPLDDSEMNHYDLELIQGE